MATTHFLSKRFPNGFPKCACGEVQSAAWCFVRKQHFLPVQWLWQNPVSFSSSLESGVVLVPNCSPRGLETVLERIAVPLKRKFAQVFLQELFDERIYFCLVERSSLGVVFPWPRHFLVMNLMITLCTAIVEQHNRAAMSLTAYSVCALRTSQRQFECVHCMDLEIIKNPTPNDTNNRR